MGIRRRRSSCPRPVGTPREKPPALLAHPTAGEIDYQNVAGGSVIPGHRYAFRGRVKATGLRNADTGAGATLMVTARFNNANAVSGYDHRVLSNVSNDVEGVFNLEFDAPADATSLQVQAPNVGVTTSASFTVAIAQMALYDLTAMGLA